MIPAVQLILSIAASIFGAKFLGLLGVGGPGGNDSSTSGRLYVLSDHPAATAPASMPAPGTSTPGTPGLPKDPGVKAIVNNVFSNGWVTWGAAALFLTLPLAFAQGRAAFADVTDTGRELASAGRSAYRRVDEADDYTALKRRRR